MPKHTAAAEEEELLIKAHGLATAPQGYPPGALGWDEVGACCVSEAGTEQREGPPVLDVDPTTAAAVGAAEAAAGDGQQAGEGQHAGDTGSSVEEPAGQGSVDEEESEQPCPISACGSQLDCKSRSTEASPSPGEAVSDSQQAGCDEAEAEQQGSEDEAASVVIGAEDEGTQQAEEEEEKDGASDPGEQEEEEGPGFPPPARSVLLPLADPAAALLVRINSPNYLLWRLCLYSSLSLATAC